VTARRVDVAVFASEDSFLDAARACRERGLEIVDARSPHPVHGFDEIAGIRRTRLPAATLVAGVAGFSLATWFQFWSSAKDWPVDVGGKPWNSMPAFLPVTFELTVLFAGLTTVAVLLVRSRLRPGGAPTFADLGTTDDRYALLVASPAGARTAPEMGRLWSSLGAESWSVREDAR
jgi:hypothetical protein